MRGGRLLEKDRKGGARWEEERVGWRELVFHY